MTICIASITKNSLTVGTDSLWSWGEDFVRDHKTSKFVELPDKYKSKLLIATAGQDKFTQIFEKLLRFEESLLDFKNRTGLIDLVEALQAEIVKHGIGEPEANALPEHDLEFLIASANTKSLWTIGSDYAINEFDDFICIGSGTFLGESAMHALNLVNVVGKRAVETALRTTMALHPMCGGREEIREISL